MGQVGVGEVGAGRDPQPARPRWHGRGTKTADRHTVRPADRRRLHRACGFTQDDRYHRSGRLGRGRERGELAGPPSHVVGECGSGGQQLERRQRGAGAGRGESGVENERAGGVDQMRTDRCRAEHRSTLAAQGLGQRHGGHHIRLAGQSDVRERSPAARADDAETVRVVDEQQRAVGPGDGV